MQCGELRFHMTSTEEAPDRTARFTIACGRLRHPKGLRIRVERGDPWGELIARHDPYPHEGSLAGYARALGVSRGWQDAFPLDVEGQCFNNSPAECGLGGSV
jgi:hypothetical protein